MESSSVLPTTQFVYRKGLGICNTHLGLFRKLQSELEIGLEDRIVQIDFSASLDRVNHQKLCSVGIEFSGLSILSQFYQTDHST